MKKICPHKTILTSHSHLLKNCLLKNKNSLRNRFNFSTCLFNKNNSELIKQEENSLLNNTTDNKAIHTLTYPIFENETPKSFKVYEKIIKLSTPNPNLEINTRNMNIEIIQELNNEEEVKFQIFTNNCNEQAWYDLNQTPQGFFSDFKFELLFRELTNQIRFNVYQSPLPSLYTRSKIGVQTNVVPSKYLMNKLDNKTKYTTLKIFIPKNIHHLKIETDIGNIIFKNQLQNVLGELFLKSTYGSIYISGNGLLNIYNCIIHMIYGHLFINKLENVKNLRINHHYSLVDHWGSFSGVLDYNYIKINKIIKNNNINILTIDPIDILIQDLQIGKYSNNFININSKTKDEPLTRTKDGIQLFINDDFNNTLQNNNEMTIKPSLLKLYSDSNPIFLYFNKDLNDSHFLSCTTQRDEVNVDFEHVAFKGTVETGQMNAIILSPNDLEKEVNYYSHIQASTKEATLYVKQFEYLSNNNNLNDNNLYENYLIKQKKDYEHYYLFGNFKLRKKEAFVYIAYFVLCVIAAIVIYYYSRPVLKFQANFMEESEFTGMGTLKPLVVATDKENREQ
ncbi:hypothetical protein ABK040_015549 [Willaertia magna]